MEKHVGIKRKQIIENIGEDVAQACYIRLAVNGNLHLPEFVRISCQESVKTLEYKCSTDALTEEEYNACAEAAIAKAMELFMFHDSVSGQQGP